MTSSARSRDGMAYQRRAGQGAPVVLVHGIPGAALAWQPVVDALPGTVEVVVPDLLGFGESAVPARLALDTVGAAAQSRAVEGLLDELGLQGVVLVGHDFGGPVSILLAHRRPDLVARLVVLSANAFPDTPVPFPLSLTTRPLVGGLAGRVLFSRPSLLMVLRQGVGSGPPPDAATHLGHRQQRRAIAAIFSGALRQLSEQYAPVEAALRGLSLPVVVGWGDRDPFFPATQGRRTAEAAGARLRVFPGAGHFLPHERPVDVAQEIELVLADGAR